MYTYRPVTPWQWLWDKHIPPFWDGIVWRWQLLWLFFRPCSLHLDATGPLWLVFPSFWSNMFVMLPSWLRPAKLITHLLVFINNWHNPFLKLNKVKKMPSYCILVYLLMKFNLLSVSSCGSHPHCSVDGLIGRSC